MSAKIRLIGGYRAYKAAAYEAQHNSRCHNPCVRYGDGGRYAGFTVQSSLYSANDDEFDCGMAAFSANTGRPYLTGSASEYLALRERIVAWIRQRQADAQMAATIDE